MRRKKIFLIFLASVLFFGGFIGWFLWQEYRPAYNPVKSFDEFMDISIVDDTDILEGKVKKQATENPGVYFEKTLLPYSQAANTLYLAQKSEVTDWVGSFSTEKDAFLCMLPDDYMQCKERAIKEGHLFTLWMVFEDYYYEFSLAVSGMPVIAISTERMEEQEKPSYEEDPDKLYFDSEDLYYGDIQVFDPGVNGKQYEITECNVRYHRKGATTGNFEKKGYAISLQDAREENVDISLLGMRSDNSWKLNAMVMDDNRIREMTASQIWELLDEANKEVNEPGPRMEYVELVLDNDYRGLYCLVEPVDEKKLELDSNDVLYKVLGWEAFEDEDVQYAIDMRWRIMSPVRIRYPKVITDYAVTWYPMRDYTNKVHHGEDGYQNIGDMVYIENVYDIFMFLMVVSANDNHYKNLYYAAEVANDGSYVMKQIPWDLDLTFGNIYDYSGKNFSSFDSNITYEYRESAAAYVIQHCEGSYENILLDRWKRYRQSFLSNEAINRLMQDNLDYLINSGVVGRENTRWPQYSMSTDIDYLLEFQSARMDWLDEYFGE